MVRPKSTVHAGLDRDTDRAYLFYGWVIVGLIFFIGFLIVGSRNGFGVFVTPMEEEFGWTRTHTSLVFMAATLSSGISQPFLGRIYDRWGGRKVVLSSLAVIGTFTILLYFTSNILFLILVFGVVMAVAMSGASITIGGALLARWFVRRRATVMAIATSGTSAGGLVLVPFAAYMMDLTSWRVTWMILGSIVLVIAMPLAFLLLRDKPSDLGLMPDGVPSSTSGGNITGVQPSRGPLEIDRWLEAFRSFPIWQLSLAYCVCGFTTSIISMHFVPFAESSGYSRVTAATAFGVLAGLNAVGVVGAGALGDRFARKNVLSGVYWLRGLGFATVILAPPPWNLWGFAVMTGFSWIATIPLTASLTADIYGLKNLATLNGMSFLAHQIGGAIGVVLAGVLFDVSGSYDTPFSMCVVLLAMAGFTAFSIREKKYSTKYQPRSALTLSSVTR